MVTFPGAYHCGFNTGFNCAEAVNVAPADWLRFGRAGVERYRAFNRPALLSYDWLLLQAGSAALAPCSSLHHRPHVCLTIGKTSAAMLSECSPTPAAVAGAPSCADTSGCCRCAARTSS